MAEKKISQLTAKGATVADTDLLVVSESAGGGSYTTKSVTGANIKGLVTDANLSTSDITTNDVSTTKHGFAPKAPNDTTKFLRGDGTWAVPASGSSAIPQTDLIYVDAILGVDDTSSGRGNIEKPFATVEYALANTTNTGTVTGNTTSGSATITSVSSTTNIKIGQYITGTNIPYNSTVISKTSNTIVLSQTATGTGSTITLTWWTPKTIKVNGEILATGNWFKPAFFYDCGTANITWGNFALFSKSSACLVPEIVNGGNWYGNHAGSVFFYGQYTSSPNDIFININTYYSISTTYQIYLYNSTNFRNFTINCNSFDARFGYLASFQGTGTVTWSGYKYGLLGGITTQSHLILYGKTETPSSVNAITTVTATSVNINAHGPIYGSVNVYYYSTSVFSDVIIGTTFTCYADWLSCLGTVAVTTATIGSRGNCSFAGPVYGSFTCGGNTEFLAFAGNFTTSSGKHILTLNDNYNGGTGSIVTSGSSEVHLYGASYSTNAYVAINVNLGSGSTIYNKANIKMVFNTNAAGTLINDGFITYLYNNVSIPLTGTFQNNGSFELIRSGQSESSTYTPTFVISTGTLILNGGKFFCQVADSKSGLIRKTASGGKLILQGQPYLKVANGLAPLQILSNTGTAQDVMDFSMIGNGALLYRLADTFSDTTYGTAYAPNLLVNGTKYESTTYSF